MTTPWNTMHRLSLPRPLLWGSLVALLSACQGLPNPGDTGVELQKVLQGRGPEAVAPGPVPVPAPVIPVTPAAKPEPLFDLQVTDLPVRAVLDGLVADTPYSLVVDPRVEGQITLNLKQVTVTEAMRVVCRVGNLDCVALRKGFMVFPKQLTSRVFQMEYPDMDRQGLSTTKVSSGQISQATSTSSSTSGLDSNRNTTTTQNTSGSQLQTRFRSDFWREMLDVVCTTLGLTAGASSAGAGGGAQTAENYGHSCQEDVAGGGRHVSASPQTGLVAVRAFPSELRRVGDLVERMKANLGRQVILEAKIVEVELSGEYQTGINWATVVNAGGSKWWGVGQTGGGTLLGGPSTASGLTSPTSSLGGVFPVSAFGGAFGVALGLNDFTAFLEALENQGKVKVLSSPRIATINSQKAVIKVGVDDYFVTKIDVSVDNGTTTLAPTFTPFFSGVALDVVPRIGDDGQVTLHVHPSVTEVTQKIKWVGELPFPLAYSASRESDSIVRARTGEIVVIGGLMKEKSSEAQAGVPVLGDLPLIGGLFGHRRESVGKTELVILLRPTILDAPPVQAVGEEFPPF
ncbi:MAG: secretin N-terminal domain-containing protein [Magnetococcales bacterium]|nr:secretin N-terminal domain-containing protein [Magnetococcales bacterium]